jgi:hypothetical protein
MRLEEDEAVLAHDYSETADPTLESEKSITVPGALPINVINLAGGGKEQGEEQEAQQQQQPGCCAVVPTRHRDGDGHPRTLRDFFMRLESLSLNVNGRGG